ncbi:MAG: type II secretion system protein GspK [Burkholderiales bacterium]
MVLIAVLWIVAALAVIVMGVTHSVRAEVRVASVERQSVVAQGAGEAAIQLVLQQMLALANVPGRLQVVQAQYRGSAIAVEVMPLSGLIDINNAPVPLLAALFSVAGGLPPDAAAAVAMATVQVRSARDSRGREIGFEATEDLLRVPGIGYDLYARVAPLVTADLRGGGRVNPMAAPSEVLTVLAGGDVARAHSIAARRDAGEVGVDTTNFDPNFIDNATPRSFRLRARVPLSGGGWLIVSRHVYLSSGARDGTAYRTYRAEQRVVREAGDGT